MANEGVNHGRRRFLTATTAVVGGVGAITAAVPFLKYWEPSAKAKLAGAPVTQDISKLEMGQMLITEWRGSPIFIVRRTKEQLAVLPSLDALLRDPKSENTSQQPAFAQNEFRSHKEHPELLVLVGVCTHLGCSPKYVGELTPEPFDPNWKGGFFCPCHKSRYDMSGRVFQGVPAPANLPVPPYRVVSDTQIVIGVNPEGAA
ncbi:ubiquinol-cytochrome c reductase iron-sulfur subunit [Pseudolysobacter antarcticus]|uniref:Ubiquinol-cytochrome c reductase iron-sulfur subunit n=1 Tax=Pseudolysobacter antarcticus TaxID=2511995 RepID=A0A411HGZ6_9GAMM|nr:ubiquinol-cytochrome c reductase iron-sulfur subunit [Pseudolysobacter antarcticus]QBB69816.1 ubiquinol-cytochrome c reductase iron-sulfur subunit [Pseudolysobacter antarcticus]